MLLALSRNSLIQIGGRKYKEIDLKKVNVHFAIEQLRINDFKKRNFDFVRVANLDSKVLLAAYVISLSGKRFYDRRIKPGKLKREFVVAKSVKKDSKRKSDDKLSQINVGNLGSKTIELPQALSEIQGHQLLIHHPTNETPRKAEEKEKPQISTENYNLKISPEQVESISVLSDSKLKRDEMRVYPEMTISRSFAEVSNNSSQFRKMVKIDDDENSDHSVEQTAERIAPGFRSGNLGPLPAKSLKKGGRKNTSSSQKKIIQDPYQNSTPAANHVKIHNQAEAILDSDRSAYQTQNPNH